MAINLINDILVLTNYDVIVTTNAPDSFSGFGDRVLVRNNIPEHIRISMSSDSKYASEAWSTFNYNLKCFAFVDIPNSYDYVIYIDADSRIERWDNSCDEWLMDNAKRYDVMATIAKDLRDRYLSYLNGAEHESVTHKWELLRPLIQGDLDSLIVGEYFMGIRVGECLDNFTKHYLEFVEFFNNNPTCPAHTEGIEIGISINRANITNIGHIGFGDFSELLGISINGGKIYK